VWLNDEQKNLIGWIYNDRDNIFMENDQ